jgi:hypothetical protein
MEFDLGKMKGMMDRKFINIKIPFHKDCSGIDMLDKCKEAVWGAEAGKDYEYFLADGSGTTLDTNSFSIDHPNGVKETLPWTLNNYLRVSNIKYPSRLRLYCIRKFITVEHHKDEEDKIDGLFEVIFMGTKKSQYRNEYSTVTGTQASMLANSLDDVDRMMDIRDELQKSESPHQLFEENPLEHGFFLNSIQVDESKFYCR